MKQKQRDAEKLRRSTMTSEMKQKKHDAEILCRQNKANAALSPQSKSKAQDDDVFYLFLQKQKIGAELHIYLEEGTYHKRLFRGPNTNDMKK